MRAQTRKEAAILEVTQQSTCRRVLGYWWAVHPHFGVLWGSVVNGAAAPVCSPASRTHSGTCWLESIHPAWMRPPPQPGTIVIAAALHVRHPPLCAGRQHKAQHSMPQRVTCGATCKGKPLRYTQCKPFLYFDEAISAVVYAVFWHKNRSPYTMHACNDEMHI